MKVFLHLMDYKIIKFNKNKYVKMFINDCKRDQLTFIYIS